jgi:hypothetical protein
MITRMETLPNEIFLHIFSYLSLFDMLTSLWSLNFRFNSLVCSAVSTNDNILNTGLAITRDLSYNKCCSILSLILNSSSLLRSIQHIHFDEITSTACGLIYEWLFNDNKILRFCNLKSLIINRCEPTKPVIQSLSCLIEHQLDELTLTIDKQMFRRKCYVEEHLSMISDIGNQLFI